MGESSSPPSLSVDGDRPLVGVPGREDGREVVRYFVDDLEGIAALPAPPAGGRYPNVAVAPGHQPAA